MDSPSKDMYDTFKDEIWKELGPLDPDWFEVLTAQTITNEGNASDQDDLCANQEGDFKPPLDKTAVDSQLSSTPKVFRRSRVVSPETEDEQSFTADQEKEMLPWMATQSPCLFRMSKDGARGAKYGGTQHQNQDSFDLLQTPQNSPVSYAKHISESLGAQIHPDISWTSSLNTPPPIASTLILTKPDESPHPVRVSGDNSVVLVRKLFPSLSNASRVGVVSPKNNDIPTVHQGVVSLEAGQNPESPNSPQSSLNQSERVWRQKLPDAIEDGEIRSTVASVLHGAEDVLSIFFTNSSSALRKVKSTRKKRKQMNPTEDHDCSSVDISSASSAAFSKQGTADQDPGRLPSPPHVKAGDVGVTQWSPLSLSEIPSCTVDTSCHNSSATQVEKTILTEQLQHGCDSSQPVSSHMKLTDCRLPKKRRKFVYTVETLKLQVQGEDANSQKTESSTGIPDSGQEVMGKKSVKALDDPDACSIEKKKVEKQRNLTEENLPPSVQAKVQDLDMSQLSRDFAQDFSQMPDHSKLSNVAAGSPRNDFSPSACLSAVKQANQKARQANLHHDCDDVSNRSSISTTNQNNPGLVSDSGFQSAAADTTHVTASSFVLPSSENNGHSQQWTGFETDICRTSPFPSPSKGNGNAHLDGILQEAETDAKLSSPIKESQTLAPSRESGMHMDCTPTQLSCSAKGTVDNINRVPPNGQGHGSLPEKTVYLPSVHTSGFKTASNKGIQISSANLERAKHLFEESEGAKPCSGQPIIRAHGSKDELGLSHGSVKRTNCNSNQPLSSSEKVVDNSCQLTASQKADVAELCTLLEEADSQFEFTQFNTAKLKQHCQDNSNSPQNADKELDPDFLTGIDFDDSFSSDAEKHLAVTLRYEKLTVVSDGETNPGTAVTSSSTGLSLSGAMRKNSSTEVAASSSKRTSEGSRSVLSAETKNLDRAGHAERSRIDNKSPSALGVGFKTARGNVLRVSKTCLSKARALFADLEQNPATSEKSPGKPNIDTSTKSQNECSADALLKGSDAVDNNTGLSVKQKQNGEPLTGSASHKKRSQKLKNVQVLKVNFSEETISEFENVDTRPTACHTGVVQHNVESRTFGCKNSAALTDAAARHGNPSSSGTTLSSPSCTKSKSIGSSSVNELSRCGGFCTASGKRVFVSDDAMEKAECLLNDIHTHEDTKKQLDPGRLASQIPISPPRNGGFQTAGGKGVAISSAALMKAKSLLSQCDEVEDEISSKPTHSKVSVADPPPMNRGFLAASGKAVTFSSEALLKAKALFSDISFSAEAPAVSHMKNSYKKQSGAGNVEKMHRGFTTAGGAKVHVSQENLLKAKNLLTEFDDGSISAAAMRETDAFFEDCDMGGKAGISEKSIAPGSDSQKKGLPKYEEDQTVTVNISEEPVSGHAEFESVTVRGMGNCEKMLHSNDVFRSTLDSTNATSLTRNPSLMAKPSPLCRASKNIHCSSIDKLSNGGGFCTASGKKVSVSDEAMAKAKFVLNEIAAFDDTKTHEGDSLPPQRGGFQTAGGKGVSISSAALKKAKSLLNQCDEVEDQIGVKRTHSKVPVPGPPPRNRGFLAASGKPVTFSSAALHKAKALFSDISFSAEAPAGSHKQDDTGHMEDGFTTAGGAKIHVSQENLLKAKNLLTEFDDGSISAAAMRETDTFFEDCDMEGKDGMSVKHRKSIASMSGSGSVKKDDPKVKQDQRVMNISEESASGYAEFKSETVGGIGNREKRLHSDDVETHEELFESTLDSPNTTSVNGNPSLMAKPSPLCRTSNTQLKGDSLPPRNGGFQTASGKELAISSAALKKAKTLFSECEGVEDQISVKPTHCKVPVPAPPSGNGGFLTASAKPVAFSSEALQKAKALFSDISFSAEIPAVPDTRQSHQKEAQTNPGKTDCRFTTAEGAKVLVSHKNLLKDFAEMECRDSNSSSSNRHDTYKSELLMERTSNSSVATTWDKNMPTKKSAPQLHKPSIPLQDTDSSGVGKLSDSPGERLSVVLGCAVNGTSGNGEGLKVQRAEESSVLHLESLNLSGCTETQQRFLAQEALDCAKALLEDESLVGQRLLMASENMPLQDDAKASDIDAKEQKGKGKRLVEDTDMSGQPPLKRRLLEEFDRTVNGPRGSTLHPEKSSPNGVMNDRKVFKYSVPLHPNITRPHSNGKNYVETRLHKWAPTQHTSPADSRSGHSKMPMFVPPFLKNVKTESHKNTAPKDNIRTPPAFVPPFKKQRTVVQESSSKAQAGEDTLHRCFTTPFNSITYVPPIKGTQSTTDVTGIKSKDDLQTVDLVYNANDNLMNNQNILVGCGSEVSAAEASRVADSLSRSQDMFQNIHNIELARDMQDMRIRKKKRQTIRPLPGSLFLTKTSGVSRIPLKAAVNGKPPARYTQKQLYSHGVHRHVYEITSETAESFRFSLQQFIQQEAFIDGGGVQLADGGWLIPCNDGTAGKEEFYRSLCDTPGVDPKLISEEWVYNHYRWIVWKQSSMERSFPEKMGGLFFTPEQVLLQLKHRYDVEVDHSRRPALRKIMEKDDTAAKTLVLCVCGVVSSGHSPKRRSFSVIKTPGADAKAENPFAIVWLTDGWYAIKAQLDEPLTAMLHKGRLSVGGKLIIHGAQLVGSQDACSPLEAPESLMLKICANSSRPTRWDTKLGFHRDPRPFLLPVSSLYSNGGPVGCVDIVILRSYPIQWMERKPDGGVVFRSVRAEEREARRHNSQKQKAVEILFAKIQAQFEKEEKGSNKPQRRRRTISRQDVANLHDGEELSEAVGDDPSYLEAHLSEQQLEALHTYRRSLMEKQQAELQDRYRRALQNAEDSEGSCHKRDVTPVWRLCVADSMDQPGSVHQLNLWRPPSDLQSLLKEGCRYKAYNLSTSDGKKLGGTITVQLTGTKKTQFQDLQASQEWLSARFQPRVSTHFVDLQNPDFQPLCGEVDLTGYVIRIIDGQGSSPAFYLTDGKLNFVKVRCFSSLAQSGLEDVVKPRVFLALSNLQLRGQSLSPTTVVYAGDLTVFSTNPKEVHLQESFSQLKNLVQGQENFFQTAEEKLSDLIKSGGLGSISSPALQTPASTRERRQDTKTSVMCQQPIRNLGSFTPVSRNPPATNCSTEKDPGSLKRRRALDYLSRIPSPPPLPLLGSVVSPCVKKTFIPPRRSGTPCTLRTVQTPACKPVSSPLEEDEWVNDEELAMIDTQALLAGD